MKSKSKKISIKYIATKYVYHIDILFKFLTLQGLSCCLCCLSPRLSFYVGCSVTLSVFSPSLPLVLCCPFYPSCPGFFCCFALQSCKGCDMFWAGHGKTCVCHCCLLVQSPPGLYNKKVLGGYNNSNFLEQR